MYSGGQRLANRPRGQKDHHGRYVANDLLHHRPRRGVEPVRVLDNHHGGQVVRKTQKEPGQQLVGVKGADLTRHL